MIVTTWVQGRTYDLNLFQLTSLEASYSDSVYSILCEKGKVLTDIAGYRNGFLLTLQGTEKVTYWYYRVLKWFILTLQVQKLVPTDSAGYRNESLLTVQGTEMDFYWHYTVHPWVLTDIGSFTHGDFED